MAAKQPSSSSHHVTETPPVGTVGGGGDNNWFDVQMAIPPEEGFSVVEEAKKAAERRKNKKKQENVALSVFTGESKKTGDDDGTESSEASGSSISDPGKTETTSFSTVSEKGEPLNRVKKRKKTGDSAIKDGESEGESHAEDHGDEGRNKKVWDLINAENESGAVSNPKPGKFDSPETFWSQGKLKKWEDTNNFIVNGKLRRDGNIAGSLEYNAVSSDEPNETEKPGSGQAMSGKRRSSLKEDFFRNYRKGSGWNLDFLRKRKMQAEEFGDGSGTENWIFQGFTAKPACKKKRISKVAQKGNNNGIMAIFMRLREEKLERRRKKRGLNPFIFIQAAGIKTEVHIFLDLMYMSCLSSYKTMRKSREEQTRKEYIFSILQPVLFGIFSALAMSKSVLENKNVVLGFLDTRAPEDLYDIASYATTGLAISYSYYFLTFEQHQIDSMLRHWEYYEACTTDLNTDRNPKRRRWVVGFCFFASILVALGKSLTVQEYDGWAFEDMMGQHACDLAVGLEMWTVEDYRNKASLYVKYASIDSFAFTYIVGSIGMAMNLLNFAQMDAIRNLIIFVTMVHDEHIRRFGEIAAETIASILPFLSNTEKDLKCWRHYRLARDDNAITNITMDKMLKINHGNNALLSAFLVTLFLDKKTRNVDVVFVSYQLLKAAYTYYVARRTVVYNNTTLEWIQNISDKCKRFIVGSVPTSRILMLFELTMSPFGIGTGSFRVDDAFIYKILGWIGSFVIVLLTFHYGGIGKEETSNKSMANHTVY